MSETQNTVTADATTTVQDPVVDPTIVLPSAGETVALSKPAPKAQRTKKNQTKQVDKFHFLYKTFAVDLAAIGVKKIVTIKASDLYRKGENFNLPFNRNLWCSGEKKRGYMTGPTVTIVASSSPMARGLIEITDSINSTSSVWLQLGGRVDIDLMFDQQATITPNSKNRDFLNPNVRTSEASWSFAYTLRSYNSTTEVAEQNLTVYVKLGGMQFSHPIKPRTVTAPNFSELAEVLEKALALDKE